jgi:amino acid transporter
VTRALAAPPTHGCRWRYEVIRANGLEIAHARVASRCQPFLRTWSAPHGIKLEPDHSRGRVLDGGRSTAELAQPFVVGSERAAPKLRREVGLVGLVFASLGSIIGAGWLFGALYASSLAGPAAIFAWLLGGAAMMLLALTHAELGATYPVAGGNARFPHYGFGSVIGFTSGWVAFLGALTVGPIMVQATLLYASNYVSSLTTVSSGRPVLTAQGYLVAAALLLLFCTINVMGVRWLAETNKLAVLWKILIPALTVVALVVTSAHEENFSAGGGFMPYGWKGVFLAMSSGGVVFAFLGFEQAVQLGGESRNPGRNIPVAIIGGMVVAVALYIALQLAYIVALDPSSLSHGWNGVSFSGKAELFGPFAGLATALGLGWLAVLLYTDAVVSPGGTGLLYTGASARLSYALSRNGYIPGAFARLTLRGAPLFAIAFSFVCGLVLFLPFPGWQQLVGFISAAAVIAYAMVPLSLGALRRQDPGRPRPFRLPAASLVAPASFIVANEILLFTGWAVVWKLIVAILVGFALLALSMLTQTKDRRPSLDWRSAVWLWPYLLGMAAISYLSSFDTRTPSSIPLLGLTGPRNELTFGWDVLAVALLSLAVYAFAIRSRLPAAHALALVGDSTGESEAEDARRRRGRRLGRTPSDTPDTGT